MHLKDKIAERIQSQGAISVAGYMELCIDHYYATRDPLGVKGDFTTSPEISQVFGELIGAWVQDKWQNLSGSQSVLCEAGPGRGTLMKDILRVTRNSGFHESSDVVLVETSPALIALQEKNLKHMHKRIRWQASLDSLPDLPLFFVANEFFDALPIHQYVNEEERKVGLVNGALAFVPEGKVTREASPVSLAVIQRIARHIKTFGGAALIIDYGYVNGEQGDTLQAVKSHQYVNPLEEPGEADLTAHVDFLALKKAVEDTGLAVSLMEQGEFLMGLGAGIRAVQLCGAASDTQKEKILSGIERLVSPQQMGILFKVMMVASEG